MTAFALLAVGIARAGQPCEPVFLGGLNTADRAVDIDVVDGIAFVADEAGHLRLYDISDPAHPQPRSVLEAVEGEALAVRAREGYAYAVYGSDGFRVFDVADSFNAGRIAELGGVHAWGLDLQGPLACLALGAGGVRLVDITNPASPFPRGSTTPDGGVNAVHIVGSIAYAVGNRLTVIDITDPDNPLTLGQIDQPGTGWAIEVAGRHAYIATGTQGVRVVDVTDPANMDVVGSLILPGSMVDLDLVGDRLYIANAGGQLNIADLSNPAAPVQIGRSTEPANTLGVVVRGNIAYIADGIAGLAAVHIDSCTGTLPCNDADLAELFGVLDLSDINAFVTGFTSQDPSGDLDNNGIFDLTDITLFVSAFLAGCP